MKTSQNSKRFIISHYLSEFKNILEMGKDDLASRVVVNNPDCPSELLAMVIKRGGNDLVSQCAACNPNCPPKALQMVLDRGKTNGVSYCAARNRNCPPEARLKWLRAVGQIKMPDLSKHDVQVVRDYNRPDDEWERFKRMVEDE